MIDVLGTALDYALVFVRDWSLVIVVAGLAFACRTRLRPAFWAGRWGGLKPRPTYAIVAALSLAMSVSLAVADGPPLPAIHDDYAVLLGAEMFASGYAAYPTHPQWESLEAMHVLQVPSYAPKYPPGQSAVLALGIVLFGCAIAGAWLAAAAACVAIVWALRALVPLEWAFAGGVAAALHPVMIEWANLYRGGALAALGGALLFGATARLLREPKDGAIAGLGLALLALTRPYEGVVLAAGCAVAMWSAKAAPSLFHSRESKSGGAASALHMLLVASLGIVALGLHNRAVTGSVTRLPWVEYAKQYDPAPPFAWQQPRPAPQYRNEEFRFWHGAMYMGEHRRLREPGGFARSIDKKLYFIFNAVSGDLGHSAVPYLWPLLLVPLVVLRRDSVLPLAVLLVFAFAPLSLAGWLLTSYLAPAAAAVAALWTIGLRAIAQRRPWLAALIAIVYVLNTGYGWHKLVERPPGIEAERRRIVAAAGPGKHLFLVAPDVHVVVANEPDIDRSQVVWARDRGDNAAVRAYFRDRKVWRVTRGESRDTLQFQKYE